MKVSVIKIGNSRGIRISKTLLEKYNIGDTVDLILENDHMLIRPVLKPRNGWDQAFMDMHANGDDDLPDDDVFENEFHLSM